MSTFDVAVIAAIAACFIAFALILAWGWAQTKDLPKPVRQPAE